MNAQFTPQQLLHQITQIQRMERGKLRVMRQGPGGPYHHLQSWEKGKNFNRYVPREQIAAYEEALAGYQTFQQLVEQYAQGVIQKTRAELAAAKKKNPSLPQSCWLKTKRSKE